MSKSDNASDRTALKAAIVSAVVTAILSPVLTIVTTRWLDRTFPGDPYQIELREAADEFHLERYSPNLPPFVYCLAYDISGTVKDHGKDVKVWRYELRLGNLTKQDLAAIDVLIEKPPGKVYLDPRGVAVRLPSGEEKTETVQLTTTSNERMRFSLAELKAGKGYTLWVHFLSKEKPLDSEINISASCEEGSFTRQTPAQWKAAGWRANPSNNQNSPPPAPPNPAS